MRRSTAIPAAVLGLLVPLAVTTPATADAGLQIRVLSGRADLVTGGDALVQVVAAGPGPLRVELNGADVSDGFEPRPDGSVVALLTGLVDGPNDVTADGAGAAARLTVTNHPIGGPVFAGPQVQPWICGTQNAGLGPAVDEQCNAPTSYRFVYRTKDGKFADYDPANPPPASDVAKTTTDEGRTVPYIVRVERGTVDRGIYDIAVLFDPAAQRGAKPAAWNGKLVVPFGPSTGTKHKQTLPPLVLDDLALARGFMVASSGLNVHGDNNNQNVGAEATMMLKEHIVERYGEIRYTIGNGASGGSIYQHTIATRYPGLLDGIQPAASYPDLWTTGKEVVGCSLLRDYFDAAPGLWPLPGQRAAVDGHQFATSCLLFDLAFGSSWDPANAANCALPQEQVYHPESNPDGVRCTPQDYQRAIWGLRASDGFAKAPLDNVGVQYGLEALDDGKITPGQFADLNAEIGSYDIDGNHVPERRAADKGAAAIAYRAGQVTDARQLAGVPIVDLRPVLPHGDFEIHTAVHSHELRARLDRDNGQHGNQVIWTFPITEVVDESAGMNIFPPEIRRDSFRLIDRWLAAIEADTSDRPLAAKVLAHKPAAAVDTCWGLAGTKITNPTICRGLYPYHGTPHTAAGEPLTHDVVKCRLKPLQRDGYRVRFTDGQWARLQKAFPSGVCDWTKSGVDQQPSVPWLTFADGPGGRPLGEAPQSQPLDAGSR